MSEGKFNQNLKGGFMRCLIFFIAVFSFCFSHGQFIDSEKQKQEERFRKTKAYLRSLSSNELIKLHKLKSKVEKEVIEATTQRRLLWAAGLVGGGALGLKFGRDTNYRIFTDRFGGKETSDSPIRKMKILPLRTALTYAYIGLIGLSVPILISEITDEEEVTGLGLDVGVILSGDDEDIQKRVREFISHLTIEELEELSHSLAELREMMKSE